MIDETIFNMLIKSRKMTHNVPPFEREIYNDGKKAISPAPEQLRCFAQNLIDNVREHRHLKGAKILLVCEASESTAKKLTKGERVKIGNARRTSPLQRVMCSGRQTEAERKKPRDDAEKSLFDLPGFDFIVTLSSDWLATTGYLDGEEEGYRKALALIDHELLHCGVKIIGSFIRPEELAQFVQNLGDSHVETCNDVQDVKTGKILVRYMSTKGKRYEWKLRKHDLEEFNGVVGRWGAWDRSVARLVDEVIKNDDTPLLDQVA